MASPKPKPQDQNVPKEDLWAQALNTLSEEDRKQFVESSSSPREVLQKVRYESWEFLDFVVFSSDYMVWRGSRKVVIRPPSCAFTITYDGIIISFHIVFNMKPHTDSKLSKSILHMASNH